MQVPVLSAHGSQIGSKTSVFTKIMDFMCQPRAFLLVRRAKSLEYLGENTLQLRSWGSDGDLGSCKLAANNYRHLHILHRGYQRVGCPTSRCFQLLEKEEEEKKRKGST